MNRTAVGLVAGAGIALLAGLAVLRETGDRDGREEPAAAPPPIVGTPEAEVADPRLPPEPPIPPALVAQPVSSSPEGGEPAPPVQTKIAPGTPDRYLEPYLLGHTPVEILEDGTQIYEGLPFTVRNPDGSTSVHRMTVRIAPTDPLPVAAEDTPPPK